VNSYSLKELRKRLNVVFQHPFIIESDSIRDNIDPRNLYSESIVDKALKDAAFKKQLTQTESQ